MITARLQGRVGPPLLQPFYDLLKLLTRRIAPVNRLQIPLVASHLVFAILTGVLFFYGSDILLIVFVLTLASVFLVLAAYSTGSPYSTIGAERELLLMTAYEPMVIIALVGLYGVAKSFNFYAILGSKMPAYLYLPGIYLGIVFVLEIEQPLEESLAGPRAELERLLETARELEASCSAGLAEAQLRAAEMRNAIDRAEVELADASARLERLERELERRREEPKPLRSAIESPPLATPASQPEAYAAAPPSTDVPLAHVLRGLFQTVRGAISGLRLPKAS